MGKLSNYQGLFRNQGDLDIPATYGVGIAVKATPQLTIAGDIQQIDYAKVPAIGTSSTCIFNGTCGLWRRAAIIDAGGWEHDTLTEDMDLSYRAQLAGWRCTYRIGLGVPGEVPADVVFAEKIREDAIRAEDLGVTRWIWPEIDDFTRVARRLALRGTSAVWTAPPS